MLLLDLILLKRDVYRHLLFNRGLGARKVGQVGISSTIVTSNGCEQETGTWGTMPQTGNDNGPPNRSMEQARWLLILELGAALVTVDAFIRWTHLSSASSFDGLEGDIASWTNDAIEGFIRIFAGCLVETVAFHAGIILACYLVLTCLNWLHSFKPHLQVAIQTPGIRQEFRYSHISLTLLYSSLTKLFLLFLLSIWRPGSSTPSLQHPPFSGGTFTHPFIVRALNVLDEDKLDREWVIRNVLGGMSAGFGLRVVLDCHPCFTTMIVLAGWAIKTVVAASVSRWVGAALGGDEELAGEMWLAYSIP